jgi:hypothetical protein
MKPKIKPAEVYNALGELGLTQAILVKAIRQGLIARDNCTDNDARSFPGTADWSRCIRSLREELTPLGWEKDDEDNRPTVVRGDRKVGIAVEIGDENTGNPDLAANLKYHKGEATKRAVNANQGELFPDKFPTKEELSAQGKLTWLLLRRRVDETTVKAELSLPAIMIDGRVAQWAERIILEPIDYDFEFQMGEDSESEPIDIPVRKIK